LVEPVGTATKILVGNLGAVLCREALYSQRPSRHICGYCARRVKQKHMSIAYLSLGSNIGDREAHLREAIERLGGTGRVTAVSSFYETEPVEFTRQAWFLNCVVALETAWIPQELMARLLVIEGEMGRQRTQKKGPRTIDIDILLFGDSIIDTSDLKIPHPAMTQRRFVLEPLAEIASDMQHPMMKKSIRELLKDLPPGQAVKRTKEK